MVNEETVCDFSEIDLPSVHYELEKAKRIMKVPSQLKTQINNRYDKIASGNNTPSLPMFNLNQDEQNLIADGNQEM